MFITFGVWAVLPSFQCSILWSVEVLCTASEFQTNCGHVQFNAVDNENVTLQKSRYKDG